MNSHQAMLWFHRHPPSGLRVACENSWGTLEWTITEE